MSLSTSQLQIAITTDAEHVFILGFNVFIEV